MSAVLCLAFSASALADGDTPITSRCGDTPITSYCGQPPVENGTSNRQSVNAPSTQAYTASFYAQLFGQLIRLLPL